MSYELTLPKDATGRLILSELTDDKSIPVLMIGRTIIDKVEVQCNLIGETPVMFSMFIKFDNFKELLSLDSNQIKRKLIDFYEKLIETCKNIECEFNNIFI